MAIQCYPTTFGAGASVTQAQWQAMLSQIIADGVNKSVGGALATSAASGMQSSIATGAAFLDGLYFNNDAAATVTHAAADPTNDRIDLIVCHADLTGGTAHAISILTGTPAPSPVAPALTQSGTVWEIPLAQVRVHAGNTAASQFAYTDRRSYATPANLALQTITVNSILQAAGVAEVGKFGGGAIASSGILTTYKGVANFKRTMINAPSSISTSIDAIVPATFVSIVAMDTQGFEWEVAPGSATNDIEVVGTYSTVGNCLRAVRADGRFDIHCDGCDRLHTGRALRSDLIINERRSGKMALKHVCPECGTEEHFNTRLTSADERLLIRGWERRMEQAFLIRQAQELLKLPRTA